MQIYVSLYQLMYKLRLIPDIVSGGSRWNRKYFYFLVKQEQKKKCGGGEWRVKSKGIFASKEIQRISEIKIHT